MQRQQETTTAQGNSVRADEKPDVMYFDDLCYEVYLISHQKSFVNYYKVW